MNLIAIPVAQISLETVLTNGKGELSLDRNSKGRSDRDGKGINRVETIERTCPHKRV